MIPVKPKVGHVPRGTNRHLWRAAFNQADREAAAARLKTMFRESISPWTCAFDRGSFQMLDMNSGKPEVGPDGTHELAGRLILGNGERRSVRVRPRVAPGDIIFLGADRNTTLEDASESLIVQKVRVTRLQSISELEAGLEGVAAMPSTDSDFPFGDDLIGRSYQAALNALRPSAVRRWQKTEAHARAREGNATLRGAFAMRWIAQHGVAEWNANPWCWVYEFELSTERPIDLLATLGPGGRVSKCASR